MSNYEEKMKTLLKKASEESKKVLGLTIEIEKRKKWQQEHRGFKKDIVDEIIQKTKDTIK